MNQEGCCCQVDVFVAGLDLRVSRLGINDGGTLKTGGLDAGILWWDSANQGLGRGDRFSVQTTAFEDFGTIFQDYGQREGDVGGIGWFSKRSYLRYTYLELSDILISPADIFLSQRRGRETNAYSWVRGWGTHE